jgi:hypothetical protein
LLQFANQSVNWTVASCRDPASPKDCVYQQGFRSILVQPRWSVSVVTESMQVGDDCDNVSDGEWRLISVLADPREARSSAWSNNSVVKGTYSNIMTNGLADVRENDTVTIALGGRECDSNGVFNLLEVFNGVQGLANVVTDSVQSCGFEEAQEVSGGNDTIGTVQIILSPVQWKTATPAAFTLVAPEDQGCTSGVAYIATFKVSAYRY